MKTVLLVLDVQKDFVSEQAKMPVAQHHIEPMIQQINRCQCDGYQTRTSLKLRKYGISTISSDEVFSC